MRSYNGNTSQQFIIAPFGSIITALEEEPVENTSLQQELYYPNPFTSQLTISNGDDFDYTIYNMTGIPVEEGKGHGTTHVGDALATGMYVLRIRSAKGNQVYKVSKQ